ncbi:hypothetical protein KC949_03615 [Candidatus Saccharibacteria bacterium]|jgi:uncharacterized metal-binding protein|nr:hypothetical protein [Candidatus Saccharibacteria bacterium]
MDWAYVLVIILAIILLLFLILGIILVVLLIRVTMNIKSVTESARRTASDVEGLVSMARGVGAAGILTKFVTDQVKKVKSVKKKRKDKTNG